jgi:chitinase
MASFSSTLCLAVALASMPTLVSAQKKVKLVGFYPDYSAGGITNVAAASLSYAIYFSIKPPVDGNVSDEYIINSIDAQRMIDMVEQGKPRGMGVLLCVGGAAESGNFPALAGNATARKKFASTLAAFCTANGLAGVDIDWEFPGAGGAANFTALSKDLRAAFGSKLVLSTNVNGPDNSSYTAEAMQQYDWVQIMSYDNDWPIGSGPHSTLGQAQTHLSNYANKIGAANKNKLVLGVPFYGKRSAAPQTATYRDILKDNPSLSPTADDAAGYNFNGTSTLAAKTNYVIEQGYGGIMIWNLVQDTQDGRLLGSIGAAVKAKGYEVERGPVTVGMRKTVRGAYAIRPWDGKGAVRMHAAPGAYRFTLFAADGRVMAAAAQETRTGDLSWNLSVPTAGRYLYKLESQGHGATPLRETGALSAESAAP